MWEKHHPLSEGKAGYGPEPVVTPAPANHSRSRQYWRQWYGSQSHILKAVQSRTATVTGGGPVNVGSWGLTPSCTAFIQVLRGRENRGTGKLWRCTFLRRQLTPHYLLPCTSHHSFSNLRFLSIQNFINDGSASRLSCLSKVNNSTPSIFTVSLAYFCMEPHPNPR